MTDLGKSAAPPRKMSIGQAVLLTLFGVGFAIGMVVLLLALFPGLLGDSSGRAEAGTTLDVTFTYMDGDMWIHQRGRIAPPEENIVLGEYTLSWDENGFRVPAMTAQRYPIAAFGDSFTEGTTVALPWVDVLAQELDTPVQNFGYRGYGPHEIAQVAADYAGAHDRSWVLYAHFSGNDLWNANNAMEQADRSPINQLDWLLRQAGENVEMMNIETRESGSYDFPMPVIIGGSYFELVFLEPLLWWNVAPEEGFLNTETFNVIRGAMDTITESVNEDACRALIFVPSKEQIYYPYIHPESQEYFNVAYQYTTVNGRGQVVVRDGELPEEEIPAFIARLGDQRDAMHQLAEEKGWYFIDLLEPFEQAAANEELLYYIYDGHWNQEGHHLAARVIADFIRQHEDECPGDA